MREPEAQIGNSGQKRDLGDAPRRDSERNRQRIVARGAAVAAAGTPTNQPQHSGSQLYSVYAICWTVCLSLWLVQFVGGTATFIRLFPLQSRLPSPYWMLWTKAWWIGWIDISYVVIPAILLAILPGKRRQDCHLSFRGFREHFWLYVGLYLAVLPLIWLVSRTSTFSTFYPMYAQAGRSWSDLLLWECLYASQFVALEFFFRGFLLGGLGKQIGVLAVPVTVIPYMMIHFGKPPLEAAAAVIAGLVLGLLAWKTKSIWGGVCVHFGVALTMDLLALVHKGQLL